MTVKPDVLFADDIDVLRTARETRNSHLNAALSSATQCCEDLVLEGTLVRMELYHLRHFSAGDSAPWHRHPFTELTWIEGGPVTYEYDGKILDLGEGEFFLMPGFTPHRWHTSAPSASLHGFMLTLIPVSDRKHSLLPHISSAATALGYRLPADARVSSALNHAEEEAILGSLGAQAAAGYLRAAIARLLRRIVAAIPSDTGEQDATRTEETPVALELATTFIASQLARPIDVATISSHAGVSARQLDRLFHAAFDMPTGAFLLHSRLERARYLLRDSDLRVKQIASSCGFSDPNYFSRVFRKRHGLSPREYRRESA